MSAEQKCRLTGYVFWICLVTSIALLVGGFLTPPTAIIDKSVIISVSELFAFAALGVGLEAVRLGRNLRISKGDLVAEITRKKKGEPAPFEAPADNYEQTENLEDNDYGR